MIENALEVNKSVGEHPLADRIDRIFVTKTREGKQFSGMLKRIQGRRLVFEQRNGAIVVIDDSEIVYAYEIPRRP